MDGPQLRGVSNGCVEDDDCKEHADGSINEPEVNEVAQPQVTTPPAKVEAITCDSTPCNGFFSYSPPNTDKENASATFQYAFERYKYGHGGEKQPDGTQKEIFMPKNVGMACTNEWKEARGNWTNRLVNVHIDDDSIAVYEPH